MRLRPTVLAMVPLVAAALIGCGGSSTTTPAPATTSGGTAPVTTVPPSTAPDPGTSTPAPDAETGKRLAIAGILQGERIAVTLLEVRDPVQITTETPFEPGEGDRYYALRLKVENIGTVPTNESPQTAAKLFVDGGAVDPEILSAVSPGFDGNPTIAVRGSLTGWVTFEISQNAVPQRLTYTPRAGFSKESGSWALN